MVVRGEVLQDLVRSARLEWLETDAAARRRAPPRARTRGATTDSICARSSSFEKLLTIYGLGHLPEVLAGDPPHEPGGCFAQAWSDGEVLRVIDLLSRRGARNDATMAWSAGRG